jgi:hypothetical protein
MDLIFLREVIGFPRHWDDGRGEAVQVVKILTNKGTNR